MSKKKKFILSSIALLSTAFISGSIFAVNHTCKRNKKYNDIYMNEEYLEWYYSQNFIDVSITSFDQLILKGLLLEAKEPTDKVIIAFHGYHSTPMKQYKHFLRFFHELGYNILLPSQRSHADSEGTYIGFGWLERLDALKWISFIKDYYNKDLQIALHGISMGGATVMCASGEDLPKDVKCIIEDCGYTDLYSQLKHVSKNDNKYLRPFLLSGSLISQFITGYSFFKVSPIHQVRKTHIPILFIHGSEDNFVPTHMVYKLFKECSSRKELLIVRGAGHAKCYDTDKKLYEYRVSKFLSQYIH